MRVSSSFWRIVRGRVGSSMLALGAMLVLPGIASAAVYYPTGANSTSTAASNVNDFNDLDHLYYYSWVITGLTKLTATQTVTSASITFKDLYNWDNLANILHLDLLDTASTTAGTLVATGTNVNGSNGNAAVSMVRSATDNTPTTPTKAELQSDALDTAPNTLASATGLDLSDRSFVGQNTNPTTGTTSVFNSLISRGFTTTEANALISPAGWTIGTTLGANGGYDYTYTFDSTELTTLKTYINGGAGTTGDIALTFDPDCHYFNDGISFQFDVSLGGTGTPGVPEPTTLLLLGTGLLVAGRYRRSAKAKK